MKIDFLKKNLLKRNQIVIYAIALLLVTAGYLNFTSLNDTNATEETASMETEESSISTEEKNENKDVEESSKIADIGDAALVSSNDVVSNQTANNQNTTTSMPAEDYFTKSKLDRDTMYSQMLESYQKILNSSNSSEAQKQSATTEIGKINNTKNSIMICENLIGTKGFDKNIVLANGESVNVIIGTNKLKQEEVAQIQNIVSREMKAGIENIHITMK